MTIKVYCNRCQTVEGIEAEPGEEAAAIRAAGWRKTDAGFYLRLLCIEQLGE